jgi:hypothetical protein
MATVRQFIRELRTREGMTVLLVTAYHPKVRIAFGNKTKIHHAYACFDSQEEARAAYLDAYKDKWTRHAFYVFETGEAAAEFVKRREGIK